VAVYRLCILHLSRGICAPRVQGCRRAKDTALTVIRQSSSCHRWLIHKGCDKSQVAATAEWPHHFTAAVGRLDYSIVCMLYNRIKTRRSISLS
jgi:hypothetical protein